MTYHSDAASAFDNYPLFEPSVLEQLATDTSPEAANAIVAAFLAEIDKLEVELQAIPTGAVQGHLDSIAASAHRCKSSAGYCGTLRLQQFTTQLEAACKEDQSVEVTGLLALASDICQATKASLMSERTI